MRCGFSIGGGLITAHEYYHANNLTSVYMAYPSLPVRCEIRNTGIVSSPGGSMDQICSTVISEGGYIETGLDFSYITSTGRSLSGAAVLPVLCIALKNTHRGFINRMIVKLISTSILSDTKQSFMKFVYYPLLIMSLEEHGSMLITIVEFNIILEQPPWQI